MLLKINSCQRYMRKESVNGRDKEEGSVSACTVNMSDLLTPSLIWLGSDRNGKKQAENNGLDDYHQFHCLYSFTNAYCGPRTILFTW